MYGGAGESTGIASVAALSRPAAGHVDAHTDEARWRAWTGWDRLAALAVPEPGARVVVLAAHPDDEVLAVGGLLARLASRGCDLLFITATDGEASHPHSPSVSAGELAGIRSDELDAALAALGHAGSERVPLHLPDSALAAHETELAGRLGSHLAGAVALLAPWSRDGHPDHDTAGRAAHRAISELTAVTATTDAGVRAPALWEYPVWAWHWADPDGTSLPWERARKVDLHPHERAVKAAAVACFPSQLHPLSPDPADRAVLPPAVVAHFGRSFEIVFT